RYSSCSRRMIASRCPALIWRSETFAPSRSSCRQSRLFVALDFGRGENLDVPSLSPTELQAARRRSGRLGGRPRRPSVREAREAALAELVPPAIRTLRAHIESGAPDAWRASVKVLELALSGPEPEEPSLPTDAAQVASMGWRELTLLAARLTL